MRKKSRQSRCRAVVLWTAAAFVLMQMAIGFAVDVALPQVRDPEYVYREQLLKERMESEPQKQFVIAIGSSRILNGLDAAAATTSLHGETEVFNFGIPSSGPFLERVWQERLRKQSPKPALLLIEVLPAYFDGARIPRDQNELDGARLSAAEMGNVHPTLAALAGPIRKWSASRAFPSYRHQAELRNRLGIDRPRNGADWPEELRTIDAFGWQPRSYPLERRAALAGLAHRQYDASYQHFRIDPSQVAHLEALLGHCEKDGVRTSLLLMPEGSEFRRLYSPEMKAAIERMLVQLGERFGAPVIDARTWIDDSGFYDMHHLLPEGAREFSVKLAQEGIAPLLREKSIAHVGESGNESPR